jgi:hypothetical protein
LKYLVELDLHIQLTLHAGTVPQTSKASPEALNAAGRREKREEKKKRRRNRKKIEKEKKISSPPPKILTSRLPFLPGPLSPGIPP